MLTAGDGSSKCMPADKKCTRLQMRFSCAEIGLNRLYASQGCFVTLADLGIQCFRCRKCGNKRHKEGFVSYYLLPTGSEERNYLGLGVFLLQYFPLVKIAKLLHYNCKNINIVG